MTVRETIEQNERRNLSRYASLACESTGREAPVPPCQLRTEYMRDRDRIIHSKAFRRLKHKTQMFITPEKDHYRTRLTHTLEVSQISRTVARGMGLNEDLTEAIALGHDLGHTPFGHAGEDALTQVSGIRFRHNEQSVRVCRVLEREGRGLNLTREVLDGILHHTGKSPAETLEGQVVAICDRIAYINHDIDDSLRAGVLRESDIPQSISSVLGVGHGVRINTLVGAMIEYGSRRIREAESGEQSALPLVGMDDTVRNAMESLRTFLFENIYKNPLVKGEEGKGAEILKRLYEYYLGHLREMPPEYVAVGEREGLEIAALDYVACMTDRFAVGMFAQLFIPKGWNI